MSEDEGVDFSHLPDVVWVSVMQYLTFNERNKVSQTCKLLSEVFHHPSLWRKVEIILSSKEGHPPDVTLIGHDRIIKLIEYFGRYIKEVTLVYLSFDKLVPDSCLKVLDALRTECHFEKLIIDFETTLGIGRMQEVMPVLELIRTAEHLQSLSLRSWPAYEYFDCDKIMTSIINNKNISKLENLALFWEKPEDATWVSLNIKMPEQDQSFALIQNLTCLQFLSLRSTMLTEEVVATLARFSHAPLQRLGVLVTYERVRADLHTPEIAPETWLALRNRSPDLRVDFTIVTRIPSVQINLYLSENIPVGGIGYMRYASVSAFDLECIIQKFSKTLQKFICYAQPEKIDWALLNLVKSSPELTSFVYHGSIHHQTLQNIANLRGTRWFQFEVLDKFVITQELPPENEDEDEVIRMSDSGEVEFAARHIIPDQDEEERLQILQNLEANVSSVVGYSWTLRDSQTLQRKLYGIRLTGRGNVATTVVETTPTRYLIAKGWPWVYG